MAEETLNKLPITNSLGKEERFVEEQKRRLHKRFTEDKFRSYFFYGLIVFVCLVFGITLIVRIILKFF
jgi:hypothetical protein|tara:strand:- start:460 stop:663 length:204 start_codon:yes stop_codon:yes gene_type:complete